MIVGFRADASIQIGSGHIMRCLTVANKLKQKKHQCIFICRVYEGDLIELIKQYGHQVISLENKSFILRESNDEYERWLGVTEEVDADQALEKIQELDILFDWLVVDHYGLSIQWEKKLCSRVKKILVIDDLANREHMADLLLDCGLTHTEVNYAGINHKPAQYLLGPQYALLRPEFNYYRKLLDRESELSDPLKILINLGGVDKNNITSQILGIFQKLQLGIDIQLTVVMGSSAPWTEYIKKIAKSMKYETTVLVGVSNMAELMIKHNLAIGAAGSTAWERCCLGLPTIMICMAENQYMIAKDLHNLGAATSIQKEDIHTELPNILKKITASQLKTIQEKALKVTEGLGVELLVDRMYSELKLC